MAAPPVSPKERARRVAAIEQALRDGYAPVGVAAGKGSAVEEAARRLAVQPATLRHFVRQNHGAIRWALFEESEPAVKAARERVTVADEMARLRRELKQAHRDAADDALVRESIFGLSAKPLDPPDWLVAPPTGKGGPGVPVALWSDWHWGEVVRAEEVGGRNAFSAEVARDRVRKLVERTVALCFDHMVRPAYPGVVVALGGDMITGTIHDELAETNDLRTAPAILDVANVLAWALGRMAEAFGRVFVPCVVGNHGRMTLKPRAKGRVHTSFEWLVYSQLERHFQGDDRLRFVIPGEADAHFRVFDHRFMLTHGDCLGVKGGDGIIGALGPISRGRIKTRDSEAQIGRDFDTLLIGHWHSYLPLPGLIVNGSLKGYDEYARLYLRAKYQRAIQALFFVHPEHGVTSHWPVFVDEPATAGAVPSEWVAWR